MSVLPLLLALLAQGDAPPDVIDVAKKGSATLERLQKGCASWKAVHTLPTGAEVAVEVISSPDRRRRHMSGGNEDLCTIIERDGSWFVSDRSITGKYRPFEAPLFLPSLYVFLNRSELQLVVEPAFFSDARFESSAEGIGTWRNPIPEALKRQQESVLRQLEDLNKREPGHADREAAVRRAREVRDTLEKGLKVRVELKSGLVLEMGTGQFQTRIEEFKFQDRVEDDAFSIEGKKWEDCSSDLTRGSMADVIMIGHSSIQQPGQKAGDLSGCLLDLKTGKIRRIPYEGSIAQPGSFSRDRKKVYVTGTTDEGIFRLVEIDLASGVNRQLGSNLERVGFLMMGVVSPDGRTVAAVHFGTTSKILNSRFTLIDVETGQARYVGEPMDFAFHSWLPDGKGVILMERHYKDIKDKAEERIVRFDLDGKKTFLRNGDNPLLSPEGTSLLFQEPEGDLWMTVPLAGGEPTKLGDGFARHGFPTFSPDGSRLIMMKFRKGERPLPVVIDVKTGTSKEVPVPDGFLAMPAWR